MAMMRQIMLHGTYSACNHRPWLGSGGAVRAWLQQQKQPTPPPPPPLPPPEEARGREETPADEVVASVETAGGGGTNQPDQPAQAQVMDLPEQPAPAGDPALDRAKADRPPPSVPQRPVAAPHASIGPEPEPQQASDTPAAPVTPVTPVTPVSLLSLLIQSGEKATAKDAPIARVRSAAEEPRFPRPHRVVAPAAVTPHFAIGPYPVVLQTLRAGDLVDVLQQRAGTGGSVRRWCPG